MASVTWSENARRDLEIIYLFVARSAPTPAELLIRRIVEATRQLESFPRMGRPIPSAPSWDLRELIVGNHRIAYRVAGDNVEVLAIHHGAQDPASFDAI